MAERIHPRTRIREAIVEALKGLATSREEVASNRVDPVPYGERADLIVRTPVDVKDIEQDVMGDHETRLLTVVIEGKIATDAPDYERVLDDMALEVKDRLFEQTFLDGKFEIIHHLSDETEFEGEGDRSTGVITMTYTGQYRVSVLDSITLI